MVSGKDNRCCGKTSAITIKLKNTADNIPAGPGTSESDLIFEERPEANVPGEYAA